MWTRHRSNKMKLKKGWIGVRLTVSWYNCQVLWRKTERGNEKGWIWRQAAGHFTHTYKLHKIILLCTEVCLCGGIWVTNGFRVTILSCLWFTIISSSFICLSATFDIVWFTLWSATCLSSKCTTPPWIFSSNLTLVLSWGQKWPQDVW